MPAKLHWLTSPMSVLLAFALLWPALACKKESPSKAPQAQKARDADLDPKDDKKPAEEPVEDKKDPPDEPEAEKLKIGVDSQASLIVPANSSVSVPFTLSGTQNRDIIVGLSEAPAGVALAKAGDKVTLAWAAPLVGTHTLRFILRDRVKCEAEEADDSDCDLDPADFGKVGAKSYDVSSERFTLEVGSGTGTGGNTGNGALIAQIIKLLGGNGDVGDLLSGLSTGQLGQVLGLAQLGLDLDTIKSILGL